MALPTTKTLTGWHGNSRWSDAIRSAVTAMQAACVLVVVLALIGCDSTSTSNTSARPSPEPYDVRSQSAKAETMDAPVADVIPQMPQISEASDDVDDTHVESSADERFRLPDDRRAINADRLKQLGIHRLESKRLILLTDLPIETVSSLPDVADQLFAHLESHFGPLPEATDHSPFQVTGCLISDRSKFEQAGLMPGQTFTINHGRHHHYEFWMFNQEDDYYRRHLLLHEFTHCFMTSETGMLNIPPLWYLEGMAEYFATHQPDAADNTKLQFGVMPQSFDGFDGWGRISEFRRSFTRAPAVGDSEFTQLKVTTLRDIMPDTVGVFLSGEQYSGSWALCWFLQNHPFYRTHFAPLSKMRTRSEFIAANTRLRNDVQERLSVDWLLFQESLLEGFDTNLSWPVHADSPLTTDDGAFVLQADHEWQDSGLRLQAGDAVRLTCSGQCSVNSQPKPWISEPQGVSIEYFRGQPLGKVVGVLVGANGNFLSERISIGKGRNIKVPQTCSLWLQVNDSCASRSNNSGHFDVTFQR